MRRAAVTIGLLMALFCLVSCTSPGHEERTAGPGRTGDAGPAPSAEGLAGPPLDPEKLREELSHARGNAPDTEGWPRTVRYDCKVYDYRSGRFRQEEKEFTIREKPKKIIPHAVGVAEILWAICPRERLSGFMEFAADPEFCILADAVRKQGPVIRQLQTELIIGMKPDLVFTVFYSDAAFKSRLTKAKIPFFELGFFGTLASVKEQILLIGTVIGEKGNARALVDRMDDKVRELKAKIPRGGRKIRVLFYDTRGYVPGLRSNFNSICELIDVVNVGAEKGVDSWGQIDDETFLKWNPDIVIVPTGKNLEEQLRKSPLLAHARAVKSGKIYSIPHLYVSVTSQFLVLSADLIAGLVYGNDG